MNIRRFSSFFIILSFLMVLSPADASVLTDSFHKEFAKTDGITKVTLDNVNGDCHFFLSPKKGKLSINATVTIKGPSEEKCESYYRKVKINATRENGTLKIMVERPRSTSFFGLGNAIRMSVDFEIAIPSSLDVSVDLVNGSVSMEEMNYCSVDIVNGDIKMKGVTGASIEAVNSCMDVRDVKKRVLIDAVNGNLKLVSASPDLEKVKVEFVNGSMTVQILTACLGYLNMESATGIAVLKERKGTEVWKTRMRGKKIHISDKGKARIFLENVNGKIILLCD